MSPARRPITVLVSALLVAAVMVLAAGAPGARADAGGKAPASFLQHPSEAMAAAQVRRARHHRQLQRLRMAQSRAHARMPDTMYASTPDASTPPHPFPLDVNLKRAPAPPAAKASAVRRGHRIPLFPAASRWARGGYQGFARLVNRSEAGGEVRIEAFDDAGTRHGPVTLRIGAGEAVHFNSDHLEGVKAHEGLSGGVGAPGRGDWRLELSSGLDLEVLAYIRTSDGFLTAMHDVVSRGEAGGHGGAIFNPGRNVNQASRLRLVNPGAKASRVRIEGIDDAGDGADGAVVVSVPVGASRTVSAQELEAGGRGLTGALGAGRGKWRLQVSASEPIEMMSLLASPTGHVTNLSTVPGGEGGAQRIPLFPAAARWARDGYQGFARLINRSETGGVVRIEAFDDAGRRPAPVTFRIGAGETVHFNSDDLETGNAGKGLSGGTGAGTGDWRLRLISGLDLEVLAYIRTSDGFLTAMHDVAPVTAQAHRVVVFNPGSNRNQVEPAAAHQPGG